ncbi:cytochrome P450 [Echria macrotheca]|uniref:Cytochrome P450 n=1 Tax=Echria macrotheca TaxID=438768 RepID=A0AAJ0BGZ2_9PEZI|nr:cytochrome P450 [Echria macrotheca]
MDAVVKEAAAALWALPLQSTGVVTVLVAVLALIAFAARKSNDDEPLSLPNWKGIPFLGNTIQYIVDNGTFIDRAGEYLKTRDIVKFSLGSTPVYLVTGGKHVQALFRKSTSISSDKFLLLVMETIMCFTPEDRAKFENDHTGRLPEPAPGTAETHKGPRYWLDFHNYNARTLALTSTTSLLTAKFYDLFRDRVQAYPVGEWTTVNLQGFMRTKMAGAAIRAMAGNKFLDRVGEDEVLQAFWDYDSVTMRLMYSLPKWMDPKPWQILDRIHQIAIDWAQKDMDPVLEGKEEAAEGWDPRVGLKFLREYQRWGKENGLDVKTRAGYFVGLLLGLNGNSIPIATWALFELVQDPELLEAVRNEAETAFDTDSSGQRTLDVPRMLTLPLLQSVYVETLRLHVSVNVTREVVGDVTLGGYKLPKHALIQAPTWLAHSNEKVWSAEGHPASEFWAYRHVRYSNTDSDGKGKAEFVMSAGPNDFFPYGGGISMCPGRHFAKQEIMAALAIMVTTFDIEMIEWVTMDGKSKSDRPPRDDLTHSGSAALPPDRDMKVRWRRRL